MKKKAYFQSFNEQQQLNVDLEMILSITLPDRIQSDLFVLVVGQLRY